MTACRRPHLSSSMVKRHTRSFAPLPRRLLPLSPISDASFRPWLFVPDQNAGRYRLSARLTSLAHRAKVTPKSKTECRSRHVAGVHGLRYHRFTTNTASPRDSSTFVPGALCRHCFSQRVLYPLSACPVFRVLRTGIDGGGQRLRHVPADRFSLMPGIVFSHHP